MNPRDASLEAIAVLMNETRKLNIFEYRFFANESVVSIAYGKRQNMYR
jgi:hypothetical protein